MQDKMRLIGCSLNYTYKKQNVWLDLRDQMMHIYIVNKEGGLLERRKQGPKTI